MAVLTFPGASAVLAAQAAAMPQPDQQCGPFAAYAVLHAVVDACEVPAMLDIATAAGTAIWPHDVAAWRPAGAPLDRTGWDRLPIVARPEESGTNAADLAGGVTEVTRGSVSVVPVSAMGLDVDLLAALLQSIARSEAPIGVIANVRTGALDPGTAWDVGHFVVLWAVDVAGPDGARVAIADSYQENGAPGEAPGCRWVPLGRLADGIGAPPGRGLLLLVAADEQRAVADLVTAAGLDPTIWST